jgi:hypothetical protein
MEDNGITQELINFIVTNVKVILGITDTSKDSLLTLYATMLCNNVLIKLNRRRFPEALKYVMVDLVKDKFDSNNKEDPELKAIQSMTEYDRSVSLGASDVLKARLNLIAKQQLDANEQVINRFKLLYKS